MKVVIFLRNKLVTESTMYELQDGLNIVSEFVIYGVGEDHGRGANGGIVAWEKHKIPQTYICSASCDLQEDRFMYKKLLESDGPNKCKGGP